MNPRLARTEVILLNKHRHTFDILYSLFPRHSLPVVLQATVLSGEDLGMRLLLCEMYASGKGSVYGMLIHLTTTSRLPHNALYSSSNIIHENVARSGEV